MINANFRRNSSVQVKPYPYHLDQNNAVDIFRQYDIIIDCSDNPATRYLVSDVCVVLDKPLVSASAIGVEGTLSVFCAEGPCYRCMFPNPPPPEASPTCGESGIIGPVVGVLGCLQALQTIKIICGHFDKHAPRYMTIFSAMEEKPWRTIKMRGKSPTCVACRLEEGFNLETISHTDYVQFCGMRSYPNVSHSVSAKRLKEDWNKACIIDVREPTEFNICHIDSSISKHTSEK